MARSLAFILLAILTWPIGCVGAPKDAGAAIFIEYQRSGGFTGVDNRMVIYSDGRAKVEGKMKTCEFVLAAGSMDQLKGRLESAEFSRLAPEHLPARQRSDFFEYRVTHEGHTVRTMDTAVPLSLNPVLELLNRIVENCGAS